jgi:hypothetical protein
MRRWQKYVRLSEVIEVTSIAGHIRDVDAPPKLVGEALSEDAYKRGVELAFVERLVRLTYVRSAKNLCATRERGQPDALEAEVSDLLALHRGPLLSDAEDNLDDLPEEPDFGRFRARR